MRCLSDPWIVVRIPRWLTFSRVTCLWVNTAGKVASSQSWNSKNGFHRGSSVGRPLSSYEMVAICCQAEDGRGGTDGDGGEMKRQRSRSARRLSSSFPAHHGDPGQDSLSDTHPALIWQVPPCSSARQDRRWMSTHHGSRQPLRRSSPIAVWQVELLLGNERLSLSRTLGEHRGHLTTDRARPVVRGRRG